MIIKAYSNKELAALYGMDYQAWLDWMKRIKEKYGENLGKKIRGRWNPNQVKIIVDHLGLPSKEIFD